MNRQELEDRFEKFAVAIIEFTRQITTNMAGDQLKSQIIRSGTAPALNYAEAGDAESLKDFIHKLKIALKELRETQTALKIFRDAKMINDDRVLQLLLEENRELIAIMVSSIKTSKKGL